MLKFIKIIREVIVFGGCLLAILTLVFNRSLPVAVITLIATAGIGIVLDLVRAVLEREEK